MEGTGRLETLPELPRVPKVTIETAHYRSFCDWTWGLNGVTNSGNRNQPKLKGTAINRNQSARWGNPGLMRDNHVAKLGGSPYGERRRQDQHAWQRTVSAAEALEVLHRLYAHSFRHERVRRHIFDFKKVSRAKGLVLGQQQLAFAAHIGAQGGIEDK